MDLDLYEECCHCWERTRTDSIVSNPTVIGGPEGGNVGTQTIDASCVERWLHCLWVSGLRPQGGKVCESPWDDEWDELLKGVNTEG